MIAPAAARKLTRSPYSRIVKGRINTGIVFTIVATTPVGLCRSAIMHTTTPKNGPTRLPTITIAMARPSRTAKNTAGQRPTTVSRTT